MKWSEHTIGRALCRQIFDRNAIVLVPNCTALGCEMDVLAVTRSLRAIDVEVKISRADLKADAKKDKWWRYLNYPEALAAGKTEPGVWDPYAIREPLAWPAQVWKHYYAMPRAIWTDDLLQVVPAHSGILLLSEPGPLDTVAMVVKVKRQAKPNKAAPVLSSETIINIARLANLRMWDVYAKLEKA